MKCIWITGPSGAGKTTIARELAKRLGAFHLDGDDLRAGLNSDLTMLPQDIIENIRRAGHVAALISRSQPVVASFIAPYVSGREAVRALFPRDGSFYEVFLTAPEEELRRRDTKGLYARGAHQQKYQTGHPELQFDTTVWSVEEIVNHTLEYVR